LGRGAGGWFIFLFLVGKGTCFILGLIGRAGGGGKNLLCRKPFSSLTPPLDTRNRLGRDADLALMGRRGPALFARWLEFRLGFSGGGSVNAGHALGQGLWFGGAAREAKRRPHGGEIGFGGLPLSPRLQCYSVGFHCDLATRLVWPSDGLESAPHSAAKLSGARGHGCCDGLWS